MPCSVAYFLVFFISAVLHALFMLLCGIPIAAILFFCLYIALGLLGVRRIRTTARIRMGIKAARSQIPTHQCSGNNGRTNRVTE